MTAVIAFSIIFAHWGYIMPGRNPASEKLSSRSLKWPVLIAVLMCGQGEYALGGGPGGEQRHAVETIAPFTLSCRDRSGHGTEPDPARHNPKHGNMVVVHQ